MQCETGGLNIDMIYYYCFLVGVGAGIDFVFTIPVLHLLSVIKCKNDSIYISNTAELNAKKPFFFIVINHAYFLHLSL